MALLEAILPAAIGLFGSMIGGKSKGSETTVPTPGPWEEDQKKIWDMALAQIFGDSTTPSARDKFVQDDAYQREGGMKYLGESSKATQGYLDQIAQAANTYLSKPVSGSIGGQNISFIPKRMAESYQTLTDPAGKLLAAQDVYNERAKDYTQEFTPNRAEFNYLNFLLPLAKELQAQRWGQTTSASYSPSLLSSLASGVNSITPALEAIYKSQTPTYGTDWYRSNAEGYK